MLLLSFLMITSVITSTPNSYANHTASALQKNTKHRFQRLRNVKNRKLFTAQLYSEENKMHKNNNPMRITKTTPANNPSPKTAIIGGIAKDIERFIPNMEQNLKKIRGAFDNTITLLITDENSDNTQELLKKYSEKTPNTLFRVIENKGTFRTDKIAYARNELLSMMDGYLDQYDYVVTMDLDMWDVSTSAITETLKNQDKWDVATANDPELYYDTWALRTGYFDRSCVNTAHGWACHTLKPFIPNEEMHTQIPVEHEPIQVISAYGGLGIYKAAQLKACRAHGDCLYVARGDENLSLIHI